MFVTQTLLKVTSEQALTLQSKNCKTKRKQNSGPGRGAGGMHRPDSRRWSDGHHHNRQVEVEDKESDD